MHGMKSNKAGGHEHDGTHCCGGKKPMQRFMEVCILLLLSKQQSYGYHLAEQLKSFEIEEINASTLYRIMRRMDERGWVSSDWQKGGQGPNKRVYNITPEGRAALEEWIEVFKQRRKNIELLLSKYDDLNAAEE